MDAPLKAMDPPSPEEAQGAPEEPGTMANGSMAAPEEPGTTANGSMAAPTPGTTQGPPSTPGTSSPPCPGDEEPPEACGVPTGEQQAAVAEALGTFALRFYQHMAEAAQPDANLLFSPINVAMGLSHLLLGEGLPASTATAAGSATGSATGTAMGATCGPMAAPAHSSVCAHRRFAELPLCPQVPAVRPVSAWAPSWHIRRRWPVCTVPCGSLPVHPAFSPPRRSSTSQVRWVGGRRRGHRC